MTQSNQAAKPPSLIKRLIMLPALLLRSRRNKAAFRTRPDDVFIATYPKSGTTWMQMMLYQLCTDGDMDFDYVWDISPTLENFYMYGKPHIEAMAGPRLIKTHLSYAAIPKGSGRYIYITRDPRDVAVSFYHQHMDYGMFRGEFPAFFKRFLSGKVRGGSWLDHVSNWKANPEGLNVLYLTYEEMKKDTEAVVGKLADFLGVTLDDERLARVLERSHINYMRQFEDKFKPLHRDLDGNPIGAATEPGRFVRQGKTGGWQEYFDEDCKKAWQEVAPKWMPQ